MTFGPPFQQAAIHYNMTTARAFIGATPQIVAVLSSLPDLQRATRMRRLPDFFELRLDALHRELPAIEQILARLSAPLIITARHPAEGGLNNLSASERRALLQRFLPSSAGVDVELRSAAQLRSILATAKERKIKRIISVHDFHRAPTATPPGSVGSRCGVARGGHLQDCHPYRDRGRVGGAREILPAHAQPNEGQRHGRGQIRPCFADLFCGTRISLELRSPREFPVGRPTIAPADETMDGTSPPNHRG